MPPAIIAAIIGAAVTATTTGLELTGAFKPGTPKPADPNAVTPSLQNNQRAAIGQQLPTLQSQVGGSVSPEYYLQMSQLLSGTANQPGSAASGQDVVNQFLGQGQPGVASQGQSAGLTTGTITSGGGGGGGGSGGNSIVSSGIDDLFKQFGGGQKGLTS